MSWLFYSVDLQVWHGILLVVAMFLYRVWDVSVINRHLETIATLYRDHDNRIYLLEAQNKQLTEELHETVAALATASIQVSGNRNLQ